MLIAALEKFSEGLDNWKDGRTAEDVQHLGRTISDLNQKLMAPPGDMLEFMNSTQSNSIV